MLLVLVRPTDEGNLFMSTKLELHRINSILVPGAMALISGHPTNNNGGRVRG